MHLPVAPPQGQVLAELQQHGRAQPCCCKSRDICHRQPIRNIRTSMLGRGKSHVHNSTHNPATRQGLLSPRCTSQMNPLNSSTCQLQHPGREQPGYCRSRDICRKAANMYMTHVFNASEIRQIMLGCGSRMPRMLNSPGLAGSSSSSSCHQPGAAQQASNTSMSHKNPATRQGLLSPDAPPCKHPLNSQVLASCSNQAASNLAAAGPETSATGSQHVTQCMEHNKHDAGVWKVPHAPHAEIITRTL